MNSSEPALTRAYNQEAVQQILNITLAQYPHADTELSYSQLLEIADELRISPDTLKLPETKWLTQLLNVRLIGGSRQRAIIFGGDRQQNS
jgi:hypothetical protein